MLIVGMGLLKTTCMYIQSCILCFIRPSCQLLSLNILEYRFGNYVFTNHVQELCFQVPELVMSLNYKSTKSSSAVLTEFAFSIIRQNQPSFAFLSYYRPISTVYLSLNLGYCCNSRTTLLSLLCT